MPRTKNRGDVYVYNLVQAQFFLDCGLRPVAIGRGKHGDVFLRFKRNEATEEAFQRWRNFAREMKTKIIQIEGAMDDDKEKNPRDGYITGYSETDSETGEREGREKATPKGGVQASVQ